MLHGLTLKSFAAALFLMLLTTAIPAQAESITLPDPTLDVPLGHTDTPQTLVIAGGCFWGIQAVYQHVKGVTKAVSGYAGGKASDARYEIVGSGKSGHAEAVEVTYDPTQITLGQLLKVYFAVAHDPTQVNRQGPDSGTQYRSAIFYATDAQRNISAAYIDQLNRASVFPRSIATQLEPLFGFYPAESYHQDYARIHPHSPYIMINDLPKVAALKEQFPQLYVDKP